MANENEILRLVREKVGLDMTRSADFDVLSQAIKDTTHEKLGINTLKRLFGFKTNKVTPRLSTLDIIAQYLGYNSYHSLKTSLGNNTDISMFTDIECLEVQKLTAGTIVNIAYDPNRLLTLTYLRDSQFIVNSVEGSKNIMKGDILTITHLAVSHRLVALHVERNGVDLGPYESAKLKGIKSIELI